VDFSIILTALSVKKLHLFQSLMLLSAFVESYAYYLLDVHQMIVIKGVVAMIMSYKLFLDPLFPQLENKLLFWKK